MLPQEIFGNAGYQKVEFDCELFNVHGYNIQDEHELNFNRTIYTLFTIIIRSKCLV